MLRTRKHGTSGKLAREEEDTQPRTPKSPPHSTPPPGLRAKPEGKNSKMGGRGEYGIHVPGGAHILATRDIRRARASGEVHLPHCSCLHSHPKRFETLRKPKPSQAFRFRKAQQRGGGYFRHDPASKRSKHKQNDPPGKRSVRSG